MENSMPKVSPEELCSALQLCSVRQRENTYFAAVKRIDGSVSEIPFDDIANADEYQGFPIVRSYSSGHCFLSPDLTQVFLVTTEKKGTRQIQFTGGSPLEDVNKDVVFRKDGEIQFHLGKIEENALIRTKNRTGVDVIEHWNELPLVDRALIENTDDDGKKFRRLVCLLHYIVKSYNGELKPQVGVEEVVDGQWYNAQDVINRNMDHLAPNGNIIVAKALEIIRK